MDRSTTSHLAGWHAAAIGCVLVAVMPCGRAAGQMTGKALFAKAAPAVVKIKVFCEQELAVGSGSGFIVSRAGLVVTNYHVVQFAGTTDHIRIVLNGEARRVQGLANVMPKEDLALLAMETRPGETLRYLAVAHTPPAQGERAYAIGYPLGLENASISDGLVNGLQTIHGMRLLQTSAPISQGSSGGPLLIPDGTVVGVSVGSLTAGQNVNFAVPAEHVLRLMKEAGPARTDVPMTARPMVHQGIPRTDKPVNLGIRVDLRDLAAPMTLRRLYAGFIQPYILMGLARSGIAEAEQKARFQKYIQMMSQHRLPGRRVVCEAQIVSLSAAQPRPQVLQYLRRMVPANNPPARAAEYLRQLDAEDAYSTLAVCKSPCWPGTFTAYLHRDVANEVRARPGETVEISGFLSQWVAVPPGQELRLLLTLEACVRNATRATLATDEADRYLNVADAYLEARMPDKAAKALRTVLDRYPKSEAAKRAAKMLAELDKPAPGPTTAPAPRG